MKKPTYPNIGIYVVFHSGKKWVKNEGFKNESQKQSITRRLISWKNREREHIKLMILYLQRSEGQQEEMYRDPRSFRLWMKFSPEFYHLASKKEGGTTIINKSVPVASNDFTATEELVQKAWVHIQKSQIWQARIYNPQNQMVFEWNNLEGEKGSNWLQLTEMFAT